MIDDKKPSVLPFYLLGTLGTASFVAFFFLMGGFGRFTPQPMLLPSIANQLQLPFADVIDHYLTTTRYLGSPVSQNFDFVVILVILAYISINFFNCSYRALLVCGLFSKILLFKLLITAVPLTALAAFTSPTVALAFTQVATLLLVFIPVMWLCRALGFIERSEKMKARVQAHNPSSVVQLKQPLVLVSLQIFVVYSLGHFVSTLFNPDNSNYLLGLLQLINNEAGSNLQFERPFSLALQQLAWARYGINGALAISFFFITVKRSKVALVAVVMLLTCSFTSSFFFLPVVKEFLPLFQIHSNVLINLVQVALLTAVLWGATLYFLFKKYNEELTLWVEGK